MTTINSQDDFLRALEENPQWRDAIRRQILTEELLQLPVMFHALNQRVDTLEGKVDILTRRVDILDNKVDALTQDMAQVKSDLSALTARFDTDMAQVKSDLSTVKSDLSTLTARFDTNMAQVRSELNILNGKIDNAVGYNYQVKVERNLRSIAGQYLHLRNIAILRSSGFDVSPEFDNLIQEAVDQGLITTEQSYEVWNTDLVFIGTPRGDTTPVYVAAEVSITAGDNDITRAVRRAGLIAQATRLPVTPVIICDNADAQHQALATRHNVTAIPHPWP